MSIGIALDLTESELTELRQRTNTIDSADAVSRAAREFLWTCRLRELTSMGGKLGYVEQAWRELDVAELSQAEVNIDMGGRHDG